MIDLSRIATTLESLPDVLRTLLAPIDPDVLRSRPEPGEWSVHEIIGHLIATDADAFQGRIDSIIAGEPEIAGFDPWAAIDARTFADESLDTLLTELAAGRAGCVAFLRALDPDALSSTATHSGDRVFTAGDFVLEWPFHDQEHLQQILANLQVQYLPHMSATMRTALTTD
ncbi:DinB family protein [Ilumatobacter coccineus]|uniref:DinB-like domain-containing protein n=1 Tax=Ilumatobacter coccineus (strain NBRC 103263 / KCTC 29153 / YM16-304) TaxID=1313172 RepID=A0A6C7E336_ILUCY|nr:DinB family protein [Ilumatobacter coccineus]BAN01447.1 hypothetical protein YM304_11330 [Ilumatobacter coccineus YM16-304]